MNNYNKLALTITATMMLLGLAPGCGSEPKAGHDYYYSSNVRPQFTPSAPLLDESDEMTANGVKAHNAAGTGDPSTDHDLMMNGQSMTEQQQQIMNNIRKVNGVNDATIDIINNKIIVGLDVENVGQREAVVNDVKNMLQQLYRGYEVSVTARRADYDRIRTFNKDTASGTEEANRGINITDDLKALVREMKETFSKPLR